MHGMINRAFECFLRNTYGAALWTETMRRLDTGVDSFEPMFHYDDSVTDKMLTVAADMLDKTKADLLEDFGTYLVAHPASERVRRLLRFGGVNYEDFLLSLEDMRGRVRMAVPDLDLPELELTELGNGEFALTCCNGPSGAARVYLGLLRALADDYGALALVEYGGDDTLHIRLLETDYSEGRGFALSQRVARDG